MRIYQSITRVPSGLMVVPLFVCMGITTFFPHLLKIGGFMRVLSEAVGGD